MDITGYAKAKEEGNASMVKHGDTTILVTINGEPRGYQPFDIEDSISRMDDSEESLAAIEVVRADLASL